MRSITLGFMRETEKEWIDIDRRSELVGDERDRIKLTLLVLIVSQELWNR
jgi:hypothetical protein